MPRRIVILAAATLLCALLLIESRHESRMLFAQLQTLRAERDGINTEWEQLLLEEATWAQHRRVEQTARARLDMAIPGRDRIVVVHAPPRVQP